jgi:hypothetical protein
VGGSGDLSLERRQDLEFVEAPRRHSGDGPWWIGYLDTAQMHFGAPDRRVVLPQLWAR